MADQSIGVAEYQERFRSVQAVLKERGIDVLVTFGSESEPANLLYLANYWPAFETGAVVVPQEGRPALVIGPEARTFAEDSRVIPDLFQVLEHRESSEPDYPDKKLATYEEVFQFTLGGRKPRRVGISGMAFISVPVHQAIVRACGGAEIVKADEVLIRLRMKKSANEIRLLRESAAITLKAFEAGMKNLRPGMEEVEVAGFITAEMYRNRAESFAYSPFVLSGARTNQAISRASHRVIGKNEPIQFSLGCKYYGYASSIGRPLCVGRMPARYRELVEVGIKAQDLVIASLKPGIPAKEVYGKYWDYLTRAGYASFFLYGPCHGTGIMECEHPFLEANSGYLLEEGMTFQVDVFLGNPEFGLRFEDGAVITRSGAEPFTSAYRSVIEL
ncbi:MAG TPA: Xaa-Pro peptidase family protein [Spirochaetia bacterium]|nr:Xaa-Pro peptidase family protein [Spirochaetia bacterium]